MTDAIVYCKGVVITGGPEHHKRRFLPAVKVGMQRTIRYWHRRYLRLHFAAGAAQRYGYKARVPQKGSRLSYRARKMKYKGHRAPLTWSGTARKMVTLPIATRGTPKRATGTMYAPWYFSMRPKTRNAPALGEELIRTRTEEARDMKNVLRDDVHAGMVKNPPRKVIKLA